MEREEESKTPAAETNPAEPDLDHACRFNKYGKCKCGKEGRPHHDGDFSYLCGSDYCKCVS